MATATAKKIDPTKEAYSSLSLAFDFFNEALFDNRLPRCLITVQRHKGAFGYFSGGRFSSVRDKSVADEIAMNPAHFGNRPVEYTLSTLVHEMTHVEQHHFGEPSRNGYHNKEWGLFMQRVGLIPSDTAAPGGKQTGQKVSHYIEKGGRFDVACRRFLETVGQKFFLYHDLAGEEAKKERQKKAASKTKYTCPDCQANAWAKPDTNLKCGDCDQAMEAEPADEGDED